MCVMICWIVGPSAGACARASGGGKREGDIKQADGRKRLMMVEREEGEENVSRKADSVPLILCNFSECTVVKQTCDLLIVAFKDVGTWLWRCCLYFP